MVEVAETYIMKIKELRKKKQYAIFNIHQLNQVSMEQCLVYQLV